MTEFIQLHLLTSYPPANLNRDDTGQPKTATMGGVLRARISSQSLKRAWRTSEVFTAPLAGHVGIRTKRFAEKLMIRLMATGKKKKEAKNIASKVAKIFATVDKNTPPFTCQLVHLSPTEIAAIDAITERLVAGEKINPADELLLGGVERAADIAMFGRMLADRREHSVEAAVQVAHAVTTHAVTIEDDYFTAIDDLKSRGEDAGASHIGEHEFVSGVFYLYLCIDRGLLLHNLDNNAALAGTALRALAESAVKIGPKGKQASFASRAYASFVLAERGPQQPRSLSIAFLKPTNGIDQLATSIKALNGAWKSLDGAYGKCAEVRYMFNVHAGEGTLAELLDFVSG